MPVLAPLAASHRLAFDGLGGFSALFRRYAAGDPAALRFFARDWRSSDALAEAAAEAAALGRDRDALADVLLEQNAAWGNDDATVRRHIGALRGPESAAVVTGQQLGLFGGPLYTLYKVVIAVQLARRLTEQTGRAVAPVFWMAGEDHDWEEVRTATVLHGDEIVRLALPPGDDRTPVGRRRLGAEVEAAVAGLAEALEPTAFTDDLLAAVRAAYRPGATVREAFARLMARLFAGTGLVLMSVDDARLKRLAAPVFRAEVEGYAETHARLEAVGAELEAAGFHQQVAPMPVNLFLMEPEGRFTLDPEAGGFALRGLDRRFAKEDLLALLEAEPERFSPNVVLRPIVQDHLLPTAAYIAGPGEAAYYAQLRPVYARFGVPMPVVYPRASVTLLEGRVQRVLDRYGLGLGDLAGDLDALHRRIALGRAEHDVEAAFGEAARALNGVVDALKPIATDTDPTLERSAEALRARLQKDVEALKAKIVRAEKRKHDEVRAQLDAAQASLFPAGSPQERVLSPLYVANRYGLDVAVRLAEGLALDTAEHQVVEL